jgi:hypothetical protein
MSSEMVLIADDLVQAGILILLTILSSIMYSLMAVRWYARSEGISGEIRSCSVESRMVISP